VKYILALDQGTTSSRAIVFDGAGAIRAVAQREFAQIFPRPGWVEHDPNEIWATQFAVAGEAMARASIHAADVAAIGIANQRETTIVWDRATGEPIANAIVWQDRRTAGACDALRARGLEASIAAKTGLVLDAYFSATKLAWLLDNVDGARARAAAGGLAFGTVDAWLVWKLSGGTAHVTDASNASRTLLYNIHECRWDEELLELFDIPASLLPQVCASSGIAARTEEGLLSCRIPIAGLAGDQQAALFGQRCSRPGMVKNTYGTGCFMLMHTGGEPIPSRNKLLTTMACSAAGLHEYALEGSVFMAGAVVQWLRDGLGIIRSSAEIERLAGSVADNGGVYLVPAFAGPRQSPLGSLRARRDPGPYARRNGRAHRARGARSIAYQTADVLEAMQSDSGIQLAELRVDGGAARNDALMQFQADVLGVRVLRPRIHETTALEPRYLAGLGVGVWGSGDELDAQWQLERVFEPLMDRSEVATLRAGWRNAVARAKDWAKPL
jgi:glycerol kinase